MTYSVYDQLEGDTQGGEDIDLRKLIDSYTSQLKALGAVPQIPDSWMSAGGKDLNQVMTDPFGGGSSYGGRGVGGGKGVFVPGTIGAIAHAFKGRKGWRKAQGDAAAKQAKIDQIMAEMQTKVAEKKATINNARGARERTNLSQMVAGMFDDPSRKALYDNVYKTNLDNNLAQVQDAYKGALTHSVTRTADQGLVGGTVDTQRRGQLANTRDQGAAQAAGAAGQARNMVRQRDMQMRQQLMQLISSGDPTQAAQARAQLAQLDAQRQTVDEGAQMNQLGWNYDDYATQLNSQALGSGISGISSGVNQGSIFGRLAGSSGSGG
jgi:hypothetical protein